MDRNQKILNLFLASSWEEHYKKIIALGKELKPFPTEDRTEKLLVRGCAAKVWLKAALNTKGEVVLSGDGEREALISRGILALMLIFYSKRLPEDILKSEPLFLKELDLHRHLSSRRSNGLNALIKQIKSYAKVFLLLSKKDTT